MNGFEIETTLRSLLPGFGLRFGVAKAGTKAALKITGRRDGIAFESVFTGNTKAQCKAFAEEIRARLR